MSEAPTKKSYGLVLKKNPKLAGKAGLDGLVKAQDEKRKCRAFDSSGSEEEDVEAPPKINKPALSVTEFRVKKQTELTHEKALAEDPTVFQYDEVFDELQERKNRKLESHSEADKKREPKYMNKLLKAAERRNLEYQAREDRKQQKERVKEGGEFDDKEVFVTGAYKKQMQELEKYQAEEEKEALLEARLDVTKQQDLTGFYRKVLDDLTEPGPAKKEIKQEPEDAIKKKPEEEAPSTDDRKPKEPTKRSFRKRHDSEEGDSDGTPRESRKESPQRHKPSIYSDSSEDEGRKQSRSSTARSPPTRRKGGLEKKSEKTAQTRSERQRRFFTPSPPTSPARQQSPDPQTSNKNPVKSSPPPKRKKESKSEKTDDKKSHRNKEEEPKKLEFGIKKITPEERLVKIKALFARRNSEDSIAEYRKRYFERKSQGLIVPPV